MRIFEDLKSRPGINTAIGIALAIVAGVTLLGYITRAAEADKGGATTPVQVARVGIPTGAAIKASMLEQRSVPSDYVVPGSIKKAEDIEGARALRAISKGEPVTTSAIAGGRGEANLASKIPADMRAYTICLREGASGATDLRPGDRVDVLSTAGDPPRTTTILAGKLVLTVGTSDLVDQDIVSAGPGSLTLLVAPAEAELLAQAVSASEISVSLCPAEAQGTEGRSKR